MLIRSEPSKVYPLYDFFCSLNLIYYFRLFIPVWLFNKDISWNESYFGICVRGVTFFHAFFKVNVFSLRQRICRINLTPRKYYFLLHFINISTLLDQHIVLRSFSIYFKIDVRLKYNWNLKLPCNLNFSFETFPTSKNIS